MSITITISEDQASDIREWIEEQLASNLEIEYSDRLLDLLQTIDEALTRPDIIDGINGEFDLNFG